MIVVIANPAAGFGGKKRGEAKLRRARAVFEISDKVEILPTTLERGGAELAMSASRGGAKLVVAAGGDGTIRQVAEGLAGTGTPMAVLPLGTENVFAKFAGYPRDPAACARRILQAAEKPVDLGIVGGGTIFFSFLGIGFDARVVARTPMKLKRKLGGFSFAVTALRESFSKDSGAVFSVTGEGGISHNLPCWLMLIGNIPIYGWRLPVCPSADMTDGKLDACLFPEKGSLHSLSQALSAVRGKHLGKTRHFQFEKITIETDPVTEIQADGDLIGKTPCEIRVLPKSLLLRI